MVWRAPGGLGWPDEGGRTISGSYSISNVSAVALIGIGLPLRLNIVLSIGTVLGANYILSYIEIPA